MAGQDEYEMTGNYGQGAGRHVKVLANLLHLEGGMVNIVASHKQHVAIKSSVHNNLKELSRSSI